MSAEYKTEKSVALDSGLQLYREKLHRQLAQAKDYEEFEQLIARELSQYGLADWSYSRLDLPDSLTAAKQLGTIDKELIDTYMEQRLYESDLVMQHVNVSDRYLFQSDIEREIKQMPFMLKQAVGHNKIIQLNKSFGHIDLVTMPFTSSIDGSRFLFCLTSGKYHFARFKQHILNNLKKLEILALIINDIGAHCHAGVFLSPIKEYKALALSQPMNLLATMVKYDLSVQEGAARLGITERTASCHLKRIRNTLGAKTNLGAYKLARNYGYI